MNKNREEIIKQLTESFIKVYERDPKDENELFAFSFAAWISSSHSVFVYQILSYCFSVMSVLKGEDYVERLMENPTELAIECYLLTADAMKSLAFLQKAAALDKEVTNAMAEAMKMEPK